MAKTPDETIKWETYRWVPATSRYTKETAELLDTLILMDTNEEINECECGKPKRRGNQYCWVCWRAHNREEQA